MLRTGICVALLLSLTSCGTSQQPNPTEPAQPVATTADEPADSAAALVAANPNDPEAWQAYSKEKLGNISELIDKDSEAAKARLEEVQAFIKSHPATETEAQERQERFSDSVKQLVLMAEIVPRPLAELAAEFSAKPSDLRALERYMVKLEMELNPLVLNDPERAAELVKPAKESLVQAEEQSTDPAVDNALLKALIALRRQESTIEDGRRIRSLEGNEAAPLVVETWIKGIPVTDEDLKGKVVLLDFWATWCGPCIMGFPDLKKWQDEYTSKGLVIVGVTRWEDPSSAAEELVAFRKFADEHQLKHHLAVGQGEQLQKYYHVKAIPHMVLIGRDGKIIKSYVGGGKLINDRISAELEKLLGGKEPGAK